MANVNLIVGDDNANTLQGTSGADLIYGFDPNGPQSQVSSISATRIANGLTQPLFAAAPPGDTGRLFIVEKTGLIKIIDLSTNQIAATPFLDVTGEIATTGEQGLLGLAFDPNFGQNGYIYVNLIDVNGDTEIRRYEVSATNPNVINPSTGTLIISIDQPNAANHKGGWLGFGPDGYLYAALGDGGGGGDTFHNGQNMDSLLGKILRLDVHADAFPADPNRNYAIPADNPFVGVPGADEIWALGLRNPWRPSFDRGLGDFYIADVGQGTWEEIDIGIKGANYGWNAYEGPAAFTGGDPVSGGTLTFPIYSYNHSVGQSITGGYVYRGTSEGLQGQYFFADFSAGKVFTLRFDGTQWIATERTSQIVPDLGSITNPSSFGEDGRGNLYVVDFDGEIFRLTPNVVSNDQGDVLYGFGGNDMLFGGSGADFIAGGSENDQLMGGAGADILDGGTGNDIMMGGPGNDTYAVDSLSDTVAENANEGTDTAIAYVNNYPLVANVENGNVGLTAGLALFGNGLGNVLSGHNGSDLLAGIAGNDTLYGGGGADILDGGAGNDTMAGGTGNDTYAIDSLSDVITEGANEGTDTAIAYVNSYILGANVENGNVGLATGLALFGNGLANILSGHNGDDFLAGLPGNDTLYGGSGADILDGGAGNDTMVGGTGNDTYAIDSLSDVISENAGAGTDTAIVYVNNYILVTNLENGNVGLTSGLTLTGNGLANTLVGNSGPDTLDGAAGTDTLWGSAGNDTFVFRRGEADQDTVMDFNGNGSGAGDQLQFVGYGTLAEGATFTPVDATHWSINSADGVVHDIITVANGAVIDASDYIFV